MIKHIVLFRLNASGTKDATMKEIKTQLEKLPDIISELREIRVGMNVNPAEKWDLSLEATVKDLRDLQIYAVHPAHQAILKELIKPVLEERACIDYSF